MDLPYIKVLMCIIIAMLLTPIHAQNNFESIGETGVFIGHKFSDKYRMNNSIRSRYLLFRDNTFEYIQNQIHLIHLSTFNFNKNHSIGLGIQYRNEDLFKFSENEIRTVEQFKYRKQRKRVRYGHRFMAEQRFFQSITVFRQRYRFAVDFPLNSEKLVTGGAYLIFSTEALWSFAKAIKPVFEQRLTSQIGWQTMDSLKLQVGLNYRLTAFNIAPFNQLYFLTSCILKV